MGNKIISLTNKIWNIQSEVVACNGKSAVDILARNRNIENLESFVGISMRNTIPDPFIFVDMERAVIRIISAIKNGQKIVILGDYDVDGISSVSIFMRFFKYIGVECAYSIPSRTDDGYGLSITAINKHKEYLIIAVDCGSSSLEELKYAKDNNIDIVVIDHHKMSAIFEDTIIVNPHRPDESGEYKYLCATGLVFMCIVGINRNLKELNFYKSCREPNIVDYLDLVALATVCDVVELKELNRAFVLTGIKVIRQRKNLGIDALLSLQKKPEISSETIAFILGPKLNASGRMALADISVHLLTTENPIEAKEIANQLDSLNKKRQILEREMTEEADSFVKEDQNFICAYNPDWHIGVIGIIAGRLKEKYNRPSIIISTDSNGVGKASCRSTEKVDISAVIKRGVEQGVIISGGGHALAGGFSVETSKIDNLLEFLKSDITNKPDLPELYADCKVQLEFVSTDFVKQISTLEPFGMGNRYPKFIIPNVKIVGTKVVGENHLSFSIVGEKGNSMRAISFRSLNTPLGEILLSETSSVNVLGTLVISSWNGQVNLQLEDIGQASA
ncbi:MAG: single-stranded-DNA-specific exonuclease RecJ [Holosporaceae bacterium]|nr:single-stranded-DNA-specific exonuclease RecJ [Holosporaceae bacterium]